MLQVIKKNNSIRNKDSPVMYSLFVQFLLFVQVTAKSTVSVIVKAGFLHVTGDLSVQAGGQFAKNSIHGCRQSVLFLATGVHVSTDKSDITQKSMFKMALLYVLYVGEQCMFVKTAWLFILFTRSHM